MDNLSAHELTQLIHSVFPRFPDDHFLGILLDIPNSENEDNEDWKKRRIMAKEWAEIIRRNLNALDLDGVRLFIYPHVGSNNADLPEYAYLIRFEMPSYAYELEELGLKISFKEIFTKIKLLLAPTEFSTTAPLKNAAREFNLRAATMPGFSQAMISTLKIDYTEVNRRVMLIKEKLDQAEAAKVQFKVNDQDEHEMFFDLRFRTAHASSGRFPERGTAGNLPSGEAYIVPYEGEKDTPSRTEGSLPVQIGNELVFFSVKENRAESADGEGSAAQSEQEHLLQEPAYGNMAELGFGVLEDFGISPIGEILQDEKLGFHIAFGRSEHFGGIVGPAQFSAPDKVIHLDRIYIPATQPKIKIHDLTLLYPDNNEENIIKEGKYLIF